MKKTLLWAVALLGLTSSIFGAPVTKNVTAEDWTTAPSLKEAYKDIFEYVGFELPYNKISSEGPDFYKGVERHASTFTMENQMKPEAIIGNGPYKMDGTFTASNGLTIKVPAVFPKADVCKKLDTCLKFAVDHNLHMRGHVLTWHSQTPDIFFKENFSNSGAWVSTDEMTARHEWYIKSVLEYVKTWEDTNNGGKRVIYAWDVLNEAVADDARKGSDQYLRGSTPSTMNKTVADGGSRWWQLYQSDEFIINAYRFANKYAPKDVLLCYNDYSEYLEWGGNDGKGAWKTSGIITLINAVKAHEKDAKLPTRIDVMGCQQHVGDSWPGASGVDNAIKRLLETGLDIHITELDIGMSSKSDDKLSKIYADHFDVYVKYKKVPGKNGITSVTLWGTDDASSWIGRNPTAYPLLFVKKNGKYMPKPAFYKVIDTAK